LFALAQRLDQPLAFGQFTLQTQVDGIQVFCTLSDPAFQFASAESNFCKQVSDFFVCFLALGRTRAAPLDFWWGPMSAWLVAALVVILLGGFTILSRLKLLRVALLPADPIAQALGSAASAASTYSSL